MNEDGELLLVDHGKLTASKISENWKGSKGWDGLLAGAAATRAKADRTRSKCSKGKNFDEFHGIRDVIVS